MVFYCPKCSKCFTYYNDIIPEDSVIGEVDGVKTGIYHVRCDCLRQCMEPVYKSGKYVIAAKNEV